MWVANMMVMWRAVLAGIGIWAAIPASAMSLKQAIMLARQGDPALLAAGTNVSASHARSRQAYGALWPQVSVSTANNKNWREYATRDSPIPIAHDIYEGKSAQLNVSYSLWRRANWFAARQSDSGVAQVSHQYLAAEQDMLLRLAQAWFDLMQARDALVYAEGQSAAARHQWEQLSYGVEVGQSSAPAAEEARYKYDQALAEQQVAEADQEIKLAALEQIIGPQPGFRPPGLSDRFVAPGKRSDTLEEWLNLTEKTSPLVQAAADALEAASDEIRKQNAGHEPTIELVGSIGNNGQGAGSFPGQHGYDIKQRSIGLQVTIPIFAGGSVSAKVKEAVALRDKARHDLELARRNVRTAAKQAWFGWQAGEAHQGASQQALKFSNLALQAVEAGQDNQLKSTLDVLQVRQQHLAALRDLQRSRYEMITSYLKLLASAGRLSDGVLAGLDAWLTTDDGSALRMAQARISRAADQGSH